MRVNSLECALFAEVLRFSDAIQSSRHHHSYVVVFLNVGVLLDAHWR